MSRLEQLQSELRELRKRTQKIEQELLAAGQTELDGQPFDEVLHSFMRDVPSFVVFFDRQGRHLYLNKTIAEYSVAELIGKSSFDLLSEEQAHQLRTIFDRVFSEGVAIDFIGQDTRAFHWFMNRFTPIKINDQVVAVGSFTEDITTKIATQSQLEESEARLRFLVDSLPIVYWAVDTDLCFTDSIGAGLVGLALRQRQIVGQPLVQFLGGDTEHTRPALIAHRRAIQGEQVQYEYQFGDRFYHSLVSPLRNDRGEIIGAVGVAIDFTERAQQAAKLQADRDGFEAKVIERTQQLQAAYTSLTQQHSVLKRLVELLERDKRMMAYEIHDGLVQDMAAAQFFFGASEPAFEHLPSHCAESFQQGLQVLQKTIREARRIMNGVSPYELDQFGLIPAVEAFALEIQERTGIQVDFQCHVAQDRFAPAVDLAVFRIVQESLNNIWKHSKSTRAAVTIDQMDQELSIRVQDWGCGFDPQNVNKNNYGLISIRERTHLLGGQSEIHSQLGTGTTIIVRLPTTDAIFQIIPS
jgi:PAS domain S-box-containing protein